MATAMKKLLENRVRGLSSAYSIPGVKLFALLFPPPIGVTSDARKLDALSSTHSIAMVEVETTNHCAKVNLVISKLEVL